MTENTQSEVLCTYCHKPIDLQSSVSDDDGQPIHSECYALRFLQEKDER